MAKLKICGITSLKDALACVEIGASYLGFNFYPPSPRFIEPMSARAIIEQLPADVQSVGVFVNDPSPEDVLRVMAESGVQIAQLHGDESPAYCAAVGAERVIKALRAGPDFFPKQVLDYPAIAILLDAYDKRLYGGTGKTVAWDVAREAAQYVTLFLAGGLSPENIAQAVEAVHPFAVDVNSGVESAPGVKDAAKVRTLSRNLVALTCLYFVVVCFALMSLACATRPAENMNPVDTVLTVPTTTSLVEGRRVVKKETFGDTFPFRKDLGDTPDRWPFKAEQVTVICRGRGDFCKAFIELDGATYSLNEQTTDSSLKAIIAGDVESLTARKNLQCFAQRTCDICK